MKSRAIEKYPDLSDIFEEELKDSAAGNATKSSDNGDNISELTILEEKFRKMEVDYAQTKLELVSKECKIQELEHQLSGLEGTLSKQGANWFTKWKK